MNDAWDALSPAARRERYAWPESHWCRVNLVLSPDGAVTGSDGTSQSLTSEHDRELLREIRREADLLIVGAASVRREGLHYPPHGRVALVSRDATRAETSQHPERTEVVSLSELGVVIEKSHRVLCEGGPTVVKAIGLLGAIDELCVTLCRDSDDARWKPQLPAWLSTVQAHSRWVMASCLMDDSHAFTIWRRG